MIRPMAANVSAIPSVVAKGHQAIPLPSLPFRRVNDACKQRVLASTTRRKFVSPWA